MFYHSSPWAAQVIVFWVASPTKLLSFICAALPYSACGQHHQMPLLRTRGRQLALSLFLEPLPRTRTWRRYLVPCDIDSACSPASAHFESLLKRSPHFCTSWVRHCPVSRGKLKLPVVPSSWAGVGNVSAFLTAILCRLQQ